MSRVPIFRSPARSKLQGLVGVIFLVLGTSRAAAQEEFPLEGFEGCADALDGWICEGFEGEDEDSFPRGWEDLGAFSASSLSRVRSVIGFDGEDTKALEVQSRHGTSQGIYRPVDLKGPMYTARADVLVVEQIQHGNDNYEIEIAFATPTGPIESTDPYSGWSSAGVDVGGFGLSGYTAWDPVQQAKFGERLIPGRWYQLTLQVDTENGTLVGHVLDLETQTVFAHQTLWFSALQGKAYTVVYLASHHKGVAGAESTVLFDNLVYKDPSGGLNAAIHVSNAPEGCFPEGAEVQLEGSATSVEGTATIDRYLWDFGDGSTAEGMTAKHVYDRCGRYSVTLTVSDGEFSRTARRLVCVSGPPSSPESHTPWTAADIGDPAFPGRSHALGGGDTGCFGLCAGGRLLSGLSDQLHFVYQELAGDAVLTARVRQANGPKASWQVGLMLRESLDPRARHSAMVLRKSGAGTGFLSIRREVQSRPSLPTLGDEAALPDAWVRIARGGNEFISSWSIDGKTWTELNRVTFEDLPDRLLGGVVAIGNDLRSNLSFEPLQATVCELRVEFPPTAPRFRRGDADASGDLSITDAIFSLSYLFTGGPSPACIKSADTNDDGQLDLSDPVALLSFLFLGGSAPSAPSPHCGTDPSPDGLPCEAYAECR